MAIKPEIKLLVLDIDGTMTDGGMYFSESGDEFKKFNTKDGRGIIRAFEQGIEVAFISSGSRAVAIRNRAERLGVKRVYVGAKNKIEVLEEWMTEKGIHHEEVAAVGDDINDLGILSKVGLSACPADAVPEVLATVDIILTRKGGDACVREFIENYLLT